MSIISWIRPDTLKDPRNQWMILAGTYFFAGVIFGTLGGEWYHIAGWLICGLFSWIFVYKGFPDMWIYSFHLAVSFMIAGFGLVVMFAFPQWFGNAFLFAMAGILIQIPSLILLIILFRSVFKIREEMAIVSKYIPLGIWTLVLAGYYVSCFISALLWVLWANGTIPTKIPYFLGMIAVTYCTFYILWVPQRHFREAMETRLTKIGSKMLKSVIPKGQIVKPKKVTACPLCSDPLIIEKRKCPGCFETREFSWCAMSEVFVISCPHCGRLTSYNAPKCMVCHNPIGKKIKCKCGGSYPVSEWELIEESEDDDEDWEGT